MTDTERDSLRKLQDRWLDLPGIRHAIRIGGWDSPIWQTFEGKLGPTYAEVRDLLHPELQKRSKPRDLQLLCAVGYS